MNILIKQGTWSTIWVYLGIALGYVNNVLLFPQALGVELYGLTRIFISAGSIFYPFALLGVGNMLLRYFPSTKSTKEREQILLQALFLIILGVFGVTFFLWIARDFVYQHFAGSSALFVKNYSLFWLFNALLVQLSFLTAYLRVNLQVVFPTFLREFALRVFQTVLAVALLKQWISPNIFMYAFVGSYALQLLVLFWFSRHFFKDLKDLITQHKRQEIFARDRLYFGFFTFLTGISSALISNIDTLMIASMIKSENTNNAGLSAVALYALCSYITTLIVIPYRSLLDVGAPVLSVAMAEKDMGTLQRIYKESSLLQTLICGFIFLVLFLNIDLIFQICHIQNEHAKWIFIFLGLTRLFDCITGFNSALITLSGFYKYDIALMLLTALLTYLSNLFFIPHWGVAGAAAASAGTLFLMNAGKLFLVQSKLKMQPFTVYSFYALLLLGLCGFLFYLAPDLDNIWLNAIYKTSGIGVIYFAMAYQFGLLKTLLVWIRKRV